MCVRFAGVKSDLAKLDQNIANFREKVVRDGD
jgi:hypothetical protein